MVTPHCFLPRNSAAQTPLMFWSRPKLTSMRRASVATHHSLTLLAATMVSWWPCYCNSAQVCLLETKTSPLLCMLPVTFAVRMQLAHWFKQALTLRPETNLETHHWFSPVGLLPIAPIQPSPFQLIEAGADVKACNINGCTALTIATKCGQGTLSCELIKRGAHVDGTISFFNCLRNAVIDDRGKLEIEQLIEAGASVNERGTGGETAIHTAAFYRRMYLVKWLLDHGAEINVAKDNGFTPLHLISLVAPSYQHPSSDANDCTASSRIWCKHLCKVDLLWNSTGPRKATRTP